ncbi:MAG: hypothetical protein CSA76_06790 [Spirochaetales bacterium]|nr:MAG: hypothetical protein CSA76_06790 [Spirochaetales bacterium]
MTKFMRLLLVLVAVGLGVVFLYPTVSWYFFTDQSMKDLANGTREVIRNWSRDKAAEDVAALEKLAKDSDAVAAPLPERYDLLKDAARENYKLVDKPVPRDWTLGDVLNGFKNYDQVRKALENAYRQQVLDLKDMRGRILSLGLDLSGGLSVVLEPDFTDLEKKSSRVLSAEDRSKALESALEVINNRIDTFGVTEPQIRRQLDDSILIDLPGRG